MWQQYLQQSVGVCEYACTCGGLRPLKTLGAAQIGLVTV